MFHRVILIISVIFCRSVFHLPLVIVLSVLRITSSNFSDISSLCFNIYAACFQMNSPNYNLDECPWGLGKLLIYGNIFKVLDTSLNSGYPSNRQLIFISFRKTIPSARCRQLCICMMSSNLNSYNRVDLFNYIWITIGVKFF